MSTKIAPLTTITGADADNNYVVVCRNCGDVTREESGFTVAEGGVRITQAALYRQRHLARHLTALAAETTEATR